MTTHSMHGPTSTRDVTDWRHHAACLGEDPELFFPAPGQQAQAATAKAVCARCPVREQCAAWALATRQPAGVWGGLTTEERQELRRRRGDVRPRTSAAAGRRALAPCGTEAGYQRHMREKTRKCQECRDAHAARARASKQRSKAAAS